jgi:hypothetical protein
MKRHSQNQLLKHGSGAIITLVLGFRFSACGTSGTNVRVGSSGTAPANTSPTTLASGVLEPTSTTTGVPGRTSTTNPADYSGVATTIANSAGVKVLAPTTADLTSLSAAFNSWEDMQPTCGGQAIRGTVKVATIESTGDSWAIASFEPASSCVDYVAPGAGASSQTIPPDQVPPFEEVPGPPIGVFEKMSGGNWIMNEEGGTVFPCPAPNGAPPGPGNGSLPAQVLAAWGLSYATNCSNVNYPQEPSS